MSPVSPTDVAERLFTAIEGGDQPQLEAMFADDVAVWRSGAQRDDDRQRALAVLRWFIRVTAARSYEVIDRRVFDGGFVQQHVLHAHGRNGGTLALRVCIVIAIDGAGLISRIDEYFDPAQLAPIMD